MKQTVLITGAGGQLGRELRLTAGPGFNCIPVDRKGLDISDPEAIAHKLRESQADILINAAAYTAVDKAESEPDLAGRVNALAPGYLASACAANGVRMIHLSTDFVFDGEATQPYQPESATAPVCEYGRGKLAGEVAVQSALPEALIVRTSWVYSRFGSNFVKTMLRLMSEREELGVVCDQLGTPTWARGLVQVERKAPEDVPVQRVATVPNLIVREAAVGLVLVGFVLFMSIFWNAPLLEQANPGMSPNPAKAPWYFLGFQELLLHLHPVFAVSVWPLLAAVALLWLPFWSESHLPTGVWFGSDRGRKLAMWTAAAGALATVALILLDNLFLYSGDPVAVNTFITRGLMPTGFLIVVMTGLYFLLVNKLKYTRAEAVMAGIILVVVALTVCTIIGIWFRGAEMHLVWPWGQGAV